MGGNVENEHKKKDLKIASNLYVQMDGCRDLQKAQAANTYAPRNKQQIDQIRGGYTKKHSSFTFPIRCLQIGALVPQAQHGDVVVQKRDEIMTLSPERPAHKVSAPLVVELFLYRYHV